MSSTELQSFAQQTCILLSIHATTKSQTGANIYLLNYLPRVKPHTDCIRGKEEKESELERDEFSSLLSARRNEHRFSHSALCRRDH